MGLQDMTVSLEVAGNYAWQKGGRWTRRSSRSFLSRKDLCPPLKTSETEEGSFPSALL